MIAFPALALDAGDFLIAEPGRHTIVRFQLLQRFRATVAMVQKDCSGAISRISWK